MVRLRSPVRFWLEAPKLNYMAKFQEIEILPIFLINDIIRGISRESRKRHATQMGE